MAHDLTTGQVAFIVMHELGHVALDHPRRLRAESKTGCDSTTLRQEFEFAADGFALGLMRSKLLENLRAQTANSRATHAENDSADQATRPLPQYQSGPRTSYLHFYFL